MGRLQKVRMAAQSAVFGDPMVLSTDWRKSPLLILLGSQRAPLNTTAGAPVYPITEGPAPPGWKAAQNLQLWGLGGEEETYYLCAVKSLLSWKQKSCSPEFLTLTCVYLYCWKSIYLFPESFSMTVYMFMRGKEEWFGLICISLERI